MADSAPVAPGSAVVVEDSPLAASVAAWSLFSRKNMVNG